MKYKIHKLEINMEQDQSKLERFLNNLEGDVVSIIPNIRPTFQGMGATAKIDFLYIIENII